MNKIILACLMVGIMVGCEAQVNIGDVGPNWQNASEYYDCTVEQMEIVHKEAEWCNENTDYFGRYCYGEAIMRRCTLKEDAVIPCTEEVKE